MVATSHLVETLRAISLAVSQSEMNVHVFWLNFVSLSSHT